VSRRSLTFGLLGVLALVVIAGIVAISVSGGSSKSAKVSATSSSSPTPTSSAVATVSPTASPTPTPAATSPAAKPSLSHIPASTKTPSSLFPKAQPSTQRATMFASAHCTADPGTQVIAGRSVIIDLPIRFPAPVIFDYHGGNQSAAQEHAYTGLAAAGAQAGFIVVTPNGTNGLWNFPTTEALPDDVGFTQTVATVLAFAGCSNGKLYAAGISDGADMAVTAACRIPDVRAVFAVAPSITPRGPCSKKPSIEVHGTADPIVPYAGSAGGSFADTPSEPVAARLPFWTSGCSGPVAGQSPAAGTQVQQWNCAAGRTARLYTVSGGGHTWPGAVGNEPVAGLGARAAWSADAVALAFFSAN
jgi:polyhydroxybutyrate depolymerase